MRKQNKGGVGDIFPTEDNDMSTESSAFASDDEELPLENPVTLSSVEFLPENSQLKPKLDRIFAEVENNLPTINFELSDLSSEEDVPIFNRAFKTLVSNGPDSFQDSSDDETEKQIYEESKNKVERPLRKHLDVPPDLVISDSPKLTLATERMLQALGNNADPSDRRMKSTSLGYEDFISSTAKNKNKPLVSGRTCEIPSPCNRTSYSDANVPQAKESSAQSSRCNELLGNNRNARKRTTPLQLSSQKMVAMFFPDNYMQLELDNVDEMMSGSGRHSSDMSHGDNATVYGYDVPSLASCRNEESLMERLTKFAMSYSTPTSEDRNSSQNSKKETSEQSAKNFKGEFVSSGTSTFGYTSQQQTQGRESIKKPAGKEDCTIFIDLRTFDDQKRKEQENSDRIQRVLGLSGESSDESEPELELWFEHRKRIKESLNLGQPISTKPIPQSHRSSGASNSPKSSLSSDSSRLKTSPEAGNWTSVMKSPVKKPLKSSLGVSGCASVKKLMDDELVRPVGHTMAGGTMQEPQASVSKEKIQEAKRTEPRIKSTIEGSIPKTPPAKADRTSCQMKELDKKSRLRLEQRLKALQPEMSCRGRQPAADATHTVFDTTASYEPEPKLLPSGWSSYPECTLLTVHLSCNGQIVCHDSLRNNFKKSIDQESGMSASFNALVAWLLSLVPANFDRIGESFGEDSEAPFCVIGLQQMALEGHLTLNAVVVPVKQFTHKDVAMKGKKCQKDAYKDLSPFHKILKQFLVRNTLQSVCPFWQALESVEIHSPPNAKGKGPIYIPPLPQISSQPLSTFIQMNTALDAIHKVFLAPVGFFWQTVDNEEPCYSEVASDKEIKEPDDEEIQNTICLIYKVYRDCFAMIGIANRILQEGLCLCGLRLVYPTTELMMTMSKPMEEGPTDSTLDPILALAVRGVQARSVWLDAFGPADPALARRIDPNSLCARYGGESRDECLLFSPRTSYRIHSELARWFGGRVPLDAPIDLGEKDSPSSTFHRTKKSGCQPNEKLLDRTSVTPVATLTATTKSDIFLVVSPVVPVCCLGLVLSLCQLRGYHLSGVRRLHLSSKQAAALAISGSDRWPSFAVDLSRDHRSKTALPLRPSTIFLLKKENAKNTAASLIEAIMTHMTLKGILGAAEMCLSGVESLNSSSFFHVSSFSPAVLQALKGDFTQLKENNLFIRPGCVPNSLYTSPELEQVVVVSVCGARNCNKSGPFLAKLLGVPLWNEKQPADTEQTTEVFELLGLKWLPRLTVGLAKELTPYEVGDAGWKMSVQKLSSEPALLIVLRGVNAFIRLESIIGVPPNAHQLRSHQPQCNLDYLMSFTPEMAYRLISIFFTDNELFSDNASRPILPFIPPHQMPGGGFVTDQRGERSKLAKSSRRVESAEGCELHSESIVQSLLLPPQLFTAFLLVKSDAVCRHTGSLLKHIYQENFTIVAMKLQMLSRESVKQMLGSCAELPDMNYICGGPCLLLVLKRENAVKRLLDVVGPLDPKETRRQGGYSWRTLFGTDRVANGLHCSCDYRMSVEDQKLFFPEGLCCQPTDILTDEQIVCPAADKILDISHQKTRQLVSLAAATCTPGFWLHISGLTETTCVILTPSLLKPVSQSTKIPPFVEIMDFLLQSEFELVGCRMIWLSQIQAEHLLKLLNTGSFDLVVQLSSGPCLALALQRDVAVLALRNFLGGDSRKTILDFYAKDMLCAKDLLQAGELLTFFFDKLSPSSLVQIVPVLNESTEARS